MKSSLLTLFLMWGINSPAIDIKLECEKNAKQFKSQLIFEIQKGIPLEMVGILSKNDTIVCKNSLRFIYDLWEEKVTLEFQGQKFRNLELTNVVHEVCQKLVCQGSDSSNEIEDRFRLLLNPMWEGRVYKFLQNNPRLGQVKFYHFNAKTIAHDLPADIVIYDLELKK